MSTVSMVLPSFSALCTTGEDAGQPVVAFVAGMLVDRAGGDVQRHLRLPDLAVGGRVVDFEAGPVAFVEMLEDWRAEGSLAGLELN